MRLGLTDSLQCTLDSGCVNKTGSINSTQYSHACTPKGISFTKAQTVFVFLFNLDVFDFINYSVHLSAAVLLKQVR